MFVFRERLYAHPVWLERYRHVNLIGHTFAVTSIGELYCELSANTYAADLGIVYVPSEAEKHKTKLKVVLSHCFVLEARSKQNKKKYNKYKM